VCTDDRLLHPNPYPSYEIWCRPGVACTASRLDEVDLALSTVLDNHVTRSVLRDGVSHCEVSLGSPRQWRCRRAPPKCLCRILPDAVYALARQP